VSMLKAMVLQSIARPDKHVARRVGDISTSVTSSLNQAITKLQAAGRRRLVIRSVDQLRGSAAVFVPTAAAAVAAASACGAAASKGLSCTASAATGTVAASAAVASRATAAATGTVSATATVASRATAAAAGTMPRIPSRRFKEVALTAVSPFRFGRRRQGSGSPSSRSP
jgi:hypothetical protein